MPIVGRVIRPHGNRGQVVIDPQTEFAAERFAPGARLQTRRDDAGPIETLVVAASREQAGRWVVGLEGIGSIDEAERLRGCDLRIPAADLRELAAGQYYLHDLAGCRVRTTSGEDVGAVIRVDEIGGVAMLVVLSAGRGADEILVPFSEAICRRVDIEGKLIEIDPPDGLIDLNRRSGTP